MSQKTTSLSSTELVDLLANRRSYYRLKASSTISADKVQSILAKSLETVPSAFNNQTVRIILALGEEHHFVWDTTGKLLSAHMGEERYNSSTKGKMEGFRNAHGTVLFYTDKTDVEAMKQKFKAYAEHFDPWAEQTQGMHQLAAWVGLSAEGLGANLQHYNPVIDADLAKHFSVPDVWQLRAQLVFGEIEGDRPAPKDKKPLSETLQVYGA